MQVTCFPHEANGSIVLVWKMKESHPHQSLYFQPNSEPFMAALYFQISMGNPTHHHVYPASYVV